MSIENIARSKPAFEHLELLAKYIVEGYISGIHKSPFLGFSAEFAEHKIYNPGESTRHIDWRLFARTDKLYTKQYEEETNLRCHIIIDNSASMHYPQLKQFDLDNLNKIGFSALATACLMQLLKKQGDAVGLSIYSDTYEYYVNEKSSERHFQQIYAQLNAMLAETKKTKNTRTYTYLHQIAEKLYRRSLVLLFTDMLQTEKEEEELFNALQHLTYKKHEVVLFHVLDKDLEWDFDFENTPKRFIDVETGEHIDLYANQVKEAYTEHVASFVDKIKQESYKYKISYVSVNVKDSFDEVLLNFLLQRKKFK